MVNRLAMQAQQAKAGGLPGLGINPSAGAAGARPAPAGPASATPTGLSPMQQAQQTAQAQQQGPAQAASGPAPTGSAPLGMNSNAGLMQYLQAPLDRTAAQYSKLSATKDRLTVVRKQLDKLTQLYDTVTPEDVVKASGRLVAAGMDAGAIAGLLSNMPSGGEALQGWVSGYDNKLRAMEFRLGLLTNVVRNRMGAAGLRMLMGHAATPQGDELAAPQGAGPAPAGSGLDLSAASPEPQSGASTGLEM